MITSFAVLPTAAPIPSDARRTSIRTHVVLASDALLLFGKSPGRSSFRLRIERPGTIAIPLVTLMTSPTASGGLINRSGHVLAHPGKTLMLDRGPPRQNRVNETILADPDVEDNGAFSSGAARVTSTLSLPQKMQ